MGLLDALSGTVAGWRVLRALLREQQAQTQALERIATALEARVPVKGEAESVEVEQLDPQEQAEYDLAAAAYRRRTGQEPEAEDIEREHSQIAHLLPRRARG